MPLLQEKQYTYADYLTWDEPEHIELMEGLPVMMPPPSRAHQEISGELFRQIANYLEGKKCRVYAVPFPVRLFEKPTDVASGVDTVVEPDLSVICDRDKLDEKGCKGAPDLIIEILSPSSVRNDRLTKFNLYQRAGVREYWIVNPPEKSVQVFVLENGHYMAAALGGYDRRSKFQKQADLSHTVSINRANLRQPGSRMGRSASRRASHSRLKKRRKRGRSVIIPYA